MTETARIRWHDDAARGETLGSVGTFGRPVFRIWPPDQNGERVLLVYLAGEAQHMYHDDSEDAESALKAKAEELLTGFVSSLGAVFPEPPQPDPDCEECGFGLPRHDKDCSYYPGTTAATAGEKG